MCRFFALRANAPTTVECCLVRARNSLMAQSRRDLHGFDNADGWGIAAWQGGTLYVRRDASPAHINDDFRLAAGRVEASTIVAHVRRATVGAMVPENTHPFSHGRWALVHNGTVPYFDRLREAMLDAMTPEHRAAIRGSTDSEHLFHMILSARARQPSLPLLEVLTACLRRVLGWCHAIGPHPRLGLNVLLTDGEQLVGSRWQRTLHWVERRRLADCEVCGLAHARADPPETYRALAIASEPITGEPWREVPERAVFEVTPNLTLRVEPLEEA